MSDYPEKWELERIRRWPLEELREWLDYCHGLWNMEHGGWVTNCSGVHQISTGGWRGNEEIVRAMMAHEVAWGIVWDSSHRGGRHILNPVRTLSEGDETSLRSAERGGDLSSLPPESAAC